MNIIILIFFHVISFGIGLTLTRGFCRYFVRSMTFVRIISAFLVGILVTVTATYFLSVVYSLVPVSDPLRAGVLTAIALGVGNIIFSRFRWKSMRNIFTTVTILDGVIWIGLFFFSYYMFDKSFTSGADGTLLVARNAIFDFGHALPIVRSFSFGENIPFLSPYVAGAFHYYHFLFFFWVGILEHFLLPLTVALNGTSAIGLGSMFFFVWAVARLLVQKNKWLVGVLAVTLTLTHSTVGFFRYVMMEGISLQTIRSLWSLPNYPFAGPYDGSIISIHTTLNVFVNQRHLSFAVAVFLFFFFVFLSRAQTHPFQKKETVMMGILTGFLSLWNVFLWGFSLVSFSYLLFSEKRNKRFAFLFFFVTLGTSVLMILPWVRDLTRVLLFAGQTNMLAAKSLPVPFTEQVMLTISYYWENMSILPLIALSGFFLMPKNTRRYFSLFLLWGIGLCILRANGLLVADQKPYSAWIIGVNLMTAYALWNLFQKKILGVLMGIVLLFVVTASGFMDLMVIKNDYRFPFLTTVDQTLVSWIEKNTPPKSVFLSYADIIDPIVLSGRTNYFGYFKSAGSPDRTQVVKNVIEEITSGNDIERLDPTVQYLVLPRVGKNSFPGFSEIFLPQSTLIPLYENEKWRVYKIKD